MKGLTQIHAALTIWMKHLWDKSHSWRLVWIFFSKWYREFKCAVLKRCIMWPNDIITILITVFKMLFTQVRDHKTTNFVYTVHSNYNHKLPNPALDCISSETALDGQSSVCIWRIYLQLFDHIWSGHDPDLWPFDLILLKIAEPSITHPNQFKHHRTIFHGDKMDPKANFYHIWSGHDLDLLTFLHQRCNLVKFPQVVYEILCSQGHTDGQSENNASST